LLVRCWCKSTLIRYQSLLFIKECTSGCLKNNIKIYIKITPTCFGAVHHLQGAHYPCLLKEHFVKIVNWDQCMIKSVVMWLHMLVVSLLVCVCRTVREKKLKIHSIYCDDGNKEVCMAVSNGLILLRFSISSELL
jgi:hypothetical protein